MDAATRGLAVDLAPIRVNVVAAGVVDTDLWSGMNDEAKDAMFKEVGSKLPVGHVASATEIAEAYLFLMK
jgi:NAD(P)-dependent dehydrogenase (short-subunit alcohol dehydrogenase family)